jgi:iron(III) transport system ATP-binding protein
LGFRDLLGRIGGRSASAGASSAERSIAATRAATTFAARLTFEAVGRTFDDTIALDGASLDIAPGEVVCLLGPSGCGKTTLLRIAAGIERPTAGRVLVNGQEVAGPARFVPPEERNIGLMFQDFALFPHLTIAENVAFGLKQLAARDARREALALLARVRLEHYADQHPHILSGGEQQRVALARALVPRPAVMLMDEPFSGLDIQLRERLQEGTLELLRETRATSMIVTHHPEEAMRLGDRIAVMCAGRIVQLGRAEELYRQPVDLFVARLFSEINEIPWNAADGALVTPLGTFPASMLATGEKAVLCIRQRAIRLLPEGQGHPARALHIKFLGDAALVEMAVQGFDQPLKALVHESEVPVRGRDLGIEVDPQRVLVFAAEG